MADLSQQMTLHPGDVILTGTPAGSSVFQPGDSVSVEVSGAGVTTGELVTTATQGAEGFQPFGNPTKVSDADRIDAWGDAEAAGLAPVVEQSVLTPQVRAQLEAAAVATLSSAVKKAGVENCTVAGLSATKGRRRVIGLARTLRYVPLREDLFRQVGGGYNAQKRVIDDLNEGDVLVMEARGETGAATMGDILVTRAGIRGAAGIVSDGAVRDLAAVEDIDVPVFHSGAHPSVLGRKHIPWEIDATVACGGATIQPGDVIVADSDGIVVIPPHLVEQVAADAAAQEAQDAWVLEQVEAGHKIDGLFPPTGEWKAKFEAFKAGQN